MVFLSAAYLAAIVFLWEFTMCIASVQITKTQLIKGKMVATSYMTLQSYSDIKCVRKCFEEKRQERCSVAGYDTSTQTCFLSNDGPGDLLDADEEFGVFLYSEPECKFSYELHNYVATSFCYLWQLALTTIKMITLQHKYFQGNFQLK